MRNPEPPSTQNGIPRTRSGVLLPPSQRGGALDATGSYGPVLQSRMDKAGYSARTRDGFNVGYNLDRDDDTLIVCWAGKGGGLDDEINAALADGTIANAGISPVIFPQLPGILTRQIAQATTTEINLTGRKTPVGKARAMLSRANDSPLGATDFVAELTYRLRVYNRGAPIATVPITYPVETWGAMGMEMVPFGDDGEYFYLDVNWTKLKSPVPFLPDVLDLEPTGNNEWPYWYSVIIDRKRKWVLLHNSQIIPVLPGVSAKPGVGTSAVYQCLGFLSEHILIVDERAEKQINSPVEGMIGISGVEQSPSEIKSKIIADAKAANLAGRVLYRPWTLFTSEEEVKFSAHSFRQPNGVAFKEMREYEEDVLALAFQEPLAAVVSRGGVGHGAMSDTAATLSADGVGSVLHTIGVAFGSIYPRVTFVLNRPNDSVRQRSLERLQTFGSAVSSLPDNTLTIEEQRVIINRDIIDIPEVTGATSSQDATNDDNDGEIVEGGEEDEAATEPEETAEDRELAALLQDVRGLSARPRRRVVLTAPTVGDDDVEEARGQVAGVSERAGDIARRIVGVA